MNEHNPEISKDLQYVEDALDKMIQTGVRLAPHEIADLWHVVRKARIAYDNLD